MDMLHIKLDVSRRVDAVSALLFNIPAFLLAIVVRILFFSARVSRELPRWEKFAALFAFGAAYSTDDAAAAVAQHFTMALAKSLSEVALAEELRALCVAQQNHLEIVIVTSFTVCQEAGCTGELVASTDPGCVWIPPCLPLAGSPVLRLSASFHRRKGMAFMADGRALLATTVLKRCAVCNCVYHESYRKPKGVTDPLTVWHAGSRFIQPVPSRAFERRLLECHTLEKCVPTLRAFMCMHTARRVLCTISLLTHTMFPHRRVHGHLSFRSKATIFNSCAKIPGWDDAAADDDQPMSDSEWTQLESQSTGSLGSRMDRCACVALTVCALVHTLAFRVV